MSDNQIMNGSKSNLIVFYKHNDELHQVALTERELKLVAELIADIHGGSIKVLEDVFCRSTI